MMRLIIPVVWGLALIGLALVVTRLPSEIGTLVRLTNGFVIVSMLAWVITRVLRYERQLKAHRTEIIGLIERGETNRAQAITNLMEQTEGIAADLAGATQQLAHEVRKEHQEGQAQIVDTLKALESKVNGTTP